MALNAAKDGPSASSAHPQLRGERTPYTHHPPPSSANTPSARFLATAATPQTATIPTVPSGPSGSLTSANKDRPLTVAGLLKANANAQDPTAAALEQAVGDRNNLAAQNAQLWKLIEKQRTGYNQLLKELERVRGERDVYRGRLAASSSSSNDRRQKSSEGDNASKQRSISENASAQVNGRGAVSSSPEIRQPMARHNSDDHASRQTQQSSLHATRSHEPLNARERDQASSQPNLAYSSPASSNDSRSHTLPPPPPASAPSSVSTQHEQGNVHSNASRSLKPSPTPLIVPPRPDTLPVPASAISASQETNPFGSQIQGASGDTPAATEIRPLNPRKESLPDNFIRQPSGPLVASPPTFNGSGSEAPHLAAPPNSGLVQPQAPALTPQTAPPGFSNPDYRSAHRAATQPEVQTQPPHQLPTIRTSSVDSNQTAPIPNSSANPSSMLAAIPEGRAHLLSRESRISLPDEAKRYIANMTESPVPSPKLDSFVGGNVSSTSLPQPPTQSPLNPNGLAPPPPVDTRGADSPGGSSEFLDMNEDDEGSEADDEESAVTGPDGDEMEEPEANRIHHPVQSHSALDLQSSQEDFRSNSEPPFKPVHPMIQVQAPSNLGHTDESQESLTHEDDSEEISPLTNPYSPPSQPEPQTQPFRYEPKQQAYQASQSVPANFRALPLLPTDLPHTTVTVSHSSVRPNDRGKEVLSFIVHVKPGSGKEGWKVEKMYSDVLALDQRVRSSVGKGVGKKIASLPEGRLWKDHAPAKVDQRKAVLEGYLQSLINLPAKRNDEVIAFFTTDIVRETNQPVLQAGHKEGYLTKRGKNFGGWKTRYFVLQGPVLEYYDCRGGTHLGSIQVTGAQIGRQQRTERPPGTDDEKEYRHAFLIVEARKGPGGNHPRHVLCAESDEDRDSWVEMLVRYFSGTYSEEPLTKFGPGPIAVNPATYQNAAQPRSSTSSNDSPVSRRPQRAFSKDDIAISKGAAVPISQLPQDETTAKFFQQAAQGNDDYHTSSSPAKQIDPSPTDRHPNGGAFDAHYNARRLMEKGGQPSSLPDSSPLSSVSNFASDALTGTSQRANSELGHYPDLQQNAKANRQLSPERHRRDPHDARKSFHPSLNTVAQSPTVAGTERSSTPDKLDANAKVKISGPMNAAPIPTGFKFGGKDPGPSAAEPTPSDQRREKARSRFWNWKSNAPEKPQPVAATVSRAVFGVSLEESLDVAQIANLPAIVFRCIQYLEAKKADQEEGIYRLSGSSAVIKSLKDRFNTEGDVDLLASDEYWDPHAIAGLLKSFLRDLPASILTRDLHLRFLAVIDFVDAQERIKELSRLIAALPIANYSLLRALTAHLILVVQNSNVNKMTMRNVGIVFSPTLGIPAGVFSLMLGEFNRVFNVGAESGQPSEDDTDDEESEVDRRNSRQYSDAAADQLLGLAGRSLKTAEEVVSESDEVSMQDESGTETTDNEPPADSSSEGGPHINTSPPDTPIVKASKASHAAATRGLNVTITNPERGNRHSKIMGLPHSPRPPHSPSRQPDSR